LWNKKPQVENQRGYESIPFFICQKFWGHLNLREYCLAVEEKKIVIKIC